MCKDAKGECPHEMSCLRRCGDETAPSPGFRNMEKGFHPAMENVA